METKIVGGSLLAPSREAATSLSSELQALGAAVYNLHMSLANESSAPILANLPDGQKINIRGKTFDELPPELQVEICSEAQKTMNSGWGNVMIRACKLPFNSGCD